ncbi:endonuclease/exonuclease/phosphatase family protein [Paractinoplanes toevensis]|uniref:Endonuclease n=1 Tax=Paractinoplanes toevensis TaxID=571911 RepID=A0A920BR34_9ACTN|nr:endonuclease/exonuclease/phosphatase family protein [Actinoplanes toevensis]GIM97798.1 endonuclease [Actinoplanes toevensis]
MHVMIWNVWWRFGDDWRRREDGIAATIEAYRPDVLGLVEAWSGDGTDQAQRLGTPAGLHAAWVPATEPPADHAGIGFGLGLLSRWPILTIRRCELPHEQRGGPAPAALLATLDHPRGPLHVIVAGTEWEQRFAEDHLAQCRALAALATDIELDGSLPVLLLADLNAGPDQPELLPLLDAMVDTWAAAGADPAAVTLDSALPCAPRDAPKQIDRRVDHVFARPGRPGLMLSVHGAFLAGDRPFGGVYPSDHYAVGVDLEP